MSEKSRKCSKLILKLFPSTDFIATMTFLHSLEEWSLIKSWSYEIIYGHPDILFEGRNPLLHYITLQLITLRYRVENRKKCESRYTTN